MEHTPNKKNGFLRVERGGLYADRARSSEEKLERKVQTWAVRGRGQGKYANGKYVTRAIADIAQDLRFPHRVPARIIREALESGASPAWAREFGAMLIEYAEDKAKEMGFNIEQLDGAA